MHSVVVKRGREALSDSKVKTGCSSVKVKKRNYANSSPVDLPPCSRQGCTLDNGISIFDSSIRPPAPPKTGSYTYVYVLKSPCLQLARSRVLMISCDRIWFVLCFGTSRVATLTQTCTLHARLQLAAGNEGICIVPI